MVDMDEFYRKENIYIFKRWVYYQVKEDCDLKIEICDERTYKIYYQDKIAKFIIWPMGIVEECVFDEENLLFYLHYQFYNYYYATDLFYRMIKKLKEVKRKSICHVLLCCTSGMTTGFFADKLNQYCQSNRIPVQVEATSFHSLDKVYGKYDFIFLAPQLRFQLMKLKEKIDKKIECMDPVVFATYDCQEFIKNLSLDS